MADETKKTDKETGGSSGGAEKQQSFSGSGVPRRKKRPATLDLTASEIATGGTGDTGTGDTGTGDTGASDTGAGDTGKVGAKTTAPDDDAAGAATAPGVAPSTGSKAQKSADAGSAQPAAQSAADGKEKSAAIAPSPAARRGDNASLVGAALLGGLISAGAVFALAYFGLLPQPANDNSAIELRLSQIDSRLSKPVATQDLGAIEAQLTALADRLKATETMTSMIAALSTKVGAAETAADEARAQISALAGSLANSGDNSGTAIATLGQQIATLQKDVADLAKSSATQADTAARDAELALLRKRVVDLEQDPRDAEAAARSAAAATAAGALTSAALQRAVLDGQPYVNELEAARAFFADDPAFGILAPRAAKGVPSRAVLAAEFAALAGQIVEADRPADNGSVLGRIVERASSIVQVRPVGYVDGDSTAAAVARAEVSLQEGDLESALSELGLLKGAARSTAASFIARAEARLEAERAVASLNAGAVARLRQVGATPAGQNDGEAGASGAQSQ